MIEPAFDTYDYVISIDIGTTFSGSCYIYTKDKDTIVHVTKWPEQQDFDNFEKTPTACLYDITRSPSRMIKWGKAAMDYITTHPNDTSTRFISQFKLKLQDIFQNRQSVEEQNMVNDYRTAAIDYLRAIHQYTCQQLIQNNSGATRDQFRYVLTVPATWVNEDTNAMRDLAKEAGLMLSTDKSGKLVVLSEAHAASLFCEREYCATTENRLYKGQRYLVCDAGGGTVDLATYECTDSKEHCQLALESGGPCGSTILDLNMELYLKNQVFLGCIQDTALKGLVDQFIKEIKHYFGDDNGRNGYTARIKQDNVAVEVKSNHDITSTTIATTTATEMKDIQENDYKYQADYDEYDSDEMSIEDTYGEGFEDSDNDDYTSDTLCNNESNYANDDIAEYVYFTLPNEGAGIDPSVLENLALKGSITPAGQLRVCHRDICKHVFDPVVGTVITLIRKQIRKSHTTIDTLFLLGGFGQSPYLQKKLHEELITSTNAVNHLIVPEDGYRAAMRGGIYYGLGLNKMIPEHYLKSKCGMFLTNLMNYKALVAIDFNFYNFTAVYSFIDLQKVQYKSHRLLSDQIQQKLGREDYDMKSFYFNTDEFLEDNFPFLVRNLLQQFTIFDGLGQYNVEEEELRNRIYFDVFIRAFMQQLFEHIQLSFYATFKSDITTIRYCASISPTSVNSDSGKIYDNNLIVEQKELENAPMRTLKAQLLSALTNAKELPSCLKSSFHSFLCNILDNNPFSTERILTRTHIPQYMFDIAQSIGMISNGGSESQLHWRGENMDPGIPYFALTHYWLSKDRYYFKKKFNVLVFDLAQDTYKFTDRNLASCCRVYSKEAIVPTRENKFDSYELHYDTFVDEKSATCFISEKSLMELIEEGTFKVYTLLHFLGTETDFLQSRHIRHYIKNNIDLASLEQQHTIGDMFLDYSNQHLVKLVFRKSSACMAQVMRQAIRFFQKETITTKQILDFLLIPWIKSVLVPAILEVYDRFLTSNVRLIYSKSYFIFTTAPIETAFGGKREFEHLGKTCAHYLFCELRDEIMRRSGLLACITVCFEPNEQVNRHFGCMIDGVFLGGENKTIQAVNRVARKSYAVHFLTHNVKNAAIMTERTKKEKEEIVEEEGSTKKADDNSKDSKKDDNDDERTVKEVLIDSQDSLALYPLAQKDEPLDLFFMNKFNQTKFHVKNECSVAAVLYASDEYIDDENLYIYNNSFKKLHRFIIPVTDIRKPIQFSCLVEDYSILFSVKQAEHMADFRCNDFMYIN